MTDLQKKHSESKHLSTERDKQRNARSENFVWIAGRVVTLLGHYWRADDPVELSAAIAADWAEVLEGIPQDFIQKACLKYLKDNPARKPTPGAIRALAVALMPSRPRPIPTDHITPMRAVEDRCSKEAASEIMRAAGFRPRKFGETND
jgi:hypothetical protein